MAPRSADTTGGAEGETGAPSRWEWALDCAHLGVWDADLVAGTCYYSPGWKRMLGYDEHELDPAGDLWLEMIHPDDRRRAIDTVDLHLAGRTDRMELELRLRHRENRWIWVLDRGRIVERGSDGRPTRMIGVQTDITAQREARDELALLNRRIELALDAGGIGLWNFETDTGRVVWDARMREIYGLGEGPAEVPREAWHQRLHPDDAAAAEASSAEILRGGEPVRSTYRIVRPDGAVRHLLGLSRMVRQDGAAPILVGSILDVTDQVESARALAAEKERLRVILRSIGDAVIAADADDRITFANPAAERLLLSERDALIGLFVADALPLAEDGTGAPLANATRAAFDRRETIERDRPALLTRRDGSCRAVRDLASPVVGASGAAIGTVLVVQDVTRERARQRELAFAARHDGLTGLLNRAAFDECLAGALDAPEAERGQALLYIDLDRFKVVNDTVGHAAGDALLRLVAQALASSLPEGSITARLGGDEFAALVEASSRDEAARLAARLVDGVRALQLSWAGRVHGVGASVGVAMLGDVEADTVAALSSADAACYAAKSLGRNRALVFDPAAGAAQEGLADVRAASQLLEALKEGRILLYGQEIRSLADPHGAGAHLEVLARLVGPDGAIIPPGRFIPAAERFDLMGAFDRRVIRQALEEIGPLAAAELRVAINLSAMSLSDPELWAFVGRTMAETGVAPSRLAFEITETAAINNVAAAERFVREAREAGCRISLDDFGSGLSSFAYLRRFPVDAIKIDGAFVEEVARNRFDQAICAAVGTIAAELGIDVIAERIEDAASIEALRARGIQFGQGFLLHRPEPLGGLLERLRKPGRRAALPAS